MMGDVDIRIKVWPLSVEQPWWGDGFEDSVARLER
jgi:hypothetical protein